MKFRTIKRWAGILCLIIAVPPGLLGACIIIGPLWAGMILILSDRIDQVLRVLSPEIAIGIFLLWCAWALWDSGRWFLESSKGPDS